MAETLAEKLKRLAAEKKALAAAATVNVQPAEVTKSEEKSDGNNSVLQVRGTGTETTPENSAESCAASGDSQAAQELAPVETGSVVCVSDAVGNHSESVSGEVTTTLQPTPSNHPLKLQFAEMEQALLTTDPSFKTILRDIHRHLGTDPDLVTQMTEEEVALVVRGLVTFANAEIVAPAKAKAVKAASKKAISADDL